MDKTTRHLAEYAVATSFAALPASAIHHCKRRLVDSVGCVLGALDQDLPSKLRRIARRYPGHPGVSVWGSDTRSAPDIAAFANATAIRFLDFSDTYVSKSPGHPSDVIGGVLAVAEAEDASGADAINAIVLAYEVYCGFADAVAAHTRGVDQATAAVLGTVVGAGRLLGLPVDRMAHAVALALAPNVHLSNVRHGELSDWKGCAGPNGARNGVFAAYLAADGLTGPSGVFEGAGGLWSILGPVDWRLPEASPGTALKIEATDIKTMPLCYHGLAAAEVTLRLRERLALADLRSITVETYGLAVTRMAGDRSRWAPRTRETADHSLPFVVATVLRDGELTSASYDAERLDDPELHRLMQMVEVRESQALSSLYPSAAPARITVRLASGQDHVEEVRFPKGHAQNPVSDAELDAKLMTLGRAFGRERCGQLLQLLWRFETLPGVAALSDAIGLWPETPAHGAARMSAPAR